MTYLSSNAEVKIQVYTFKDSNSQFLEYENPFQL